MIKLVRLDERMIHGQIAIKWSRHTGVDRIIVVSDEAAANPIIQKSLLMAAPATAEEIAKSTWYCYTNSYGQESCTEDKTITEKEERVIVRELSAEEAEVINEKATPEGTIVEHEVLPTALSASEIGMLMSLMVAGLGAVTYKAKHA